jgi:hypothetical protein
MSPFLYLRGLRHSEHTVFCVEKGQKTFWDAQFSKSLAYSSGQQVKRSVIESLTTSLNVKHSPVTFISNVGKKGELGEGEAWGTCDPRHVDQLFGGWMKAQSGGENRTLKRRSPLSISAMRPLHPLLAANVKEDITFDRSDKPELHKVIVKDGNGNVLSDEQIQELLKGTDRSLRRKWIPENVRVTGLFVYDLAIDLRTLFAVSTNQYEPEISPEILSALKNDGWVESENVFGKCLVCPKEKRDAIIPALAHALINWRITSNQARTFSLMETLAVCLSDNANKIASGIRAKLKEDEEKAMPVIEEIEGAYTFIAPPAAAYVRTNTESVTALDDAENKLKAMMLDFDYENQLQSAS